MQQAGLGSGLLGLHCNGDGKKYVVWRGGIYCTVRRNIVKNSGRTKTAEEVMWGLEAAELAGLAFRVHAK